MTLVAELWKFLRIRRKFWLLPVASVMAMACVPSVLAHGPPSNPRMYKMWDHWCPVEHETIFVGTGEECNWCGRHEY